MDLPQLGYFLAVADELSFTRGAERVGVAQSAVSRAIARLEREFGLDLFVRDGRTVALTPAGERLAPLARTILDSTADTKTVLADMREEPSGLVRVGTPVSLGASHLLEAAAHVADRYPEIDLQMYSGPYQREEHALAIARGDLDLAVVVMPTRVPEGVVVTPLAETQPVLVAAPGHPLLSQTDVALADAATYPFVDFPRPYTIRTLVDGVFATRDCERDSRIEVDTMWSAVNVVSASNAVTVLPEDAVSPLEGLLEIGPIAGGLGRLELVLLSSDRREPRAVTLVRDTLLARRRTPNGS